MTTPGQVAHGRETTGGRRFDPRYLAVAFGVVFAWSEVSQSWRDWGTAGLVFTYTGFIPLQLYSAWALLRAAGRAELPLRARQALRLIAGMFVSFAIGSIWLAILSINANDEARYTPADIFYILGYPLQIVGLLLLPHGPTPTSGRLRRIIETGALLLTAAILVYTHHTLRANWNGIGDFVATATPLLSLLGLLVANGVIARGLPIPSQRAWRTLVFALTANLISELVFQTLWATGYKGPNWSLPVGVAVNLAVVWAAGWYARDPLPVGPEATRPALPFSPLPSLLAAGGAGTLLLLVQQGNVDVARPALITLIVLNALLVIREFLLVRDTTIMARRETTLESERRFEALVRHSTDLILVVDAGQIIRFASPAILTLLGRPAERTMATSLAALMHPEDRAVAQAIVDALLLIPGSPATAAVRLLHADGGWRRFECNVTNLITEPAVLGIVFNARDVTERTQLEEQLRQAQKMEVVGQLAGGVAHDFNNLLTTVLASSDFVLQEMPAGHPLREDIENIRIAAQRGAALTSRLLVFSKPNGADPRVVRIAARVQSAHRLIQRLVGDSYTLELKVDHASGAALVDPDELEHALLNLAANARDAMRLGGTITLTVEDRVLAQPLETSVLAVPAGRYVVVAVADHGVGLDLPTKERLFQPFFTTKQAQQGTGLGLTGVLAFMRRSHGGISVESTLGQGACFLLWFPRREPQEDPSSRVEAGSLTQGSGTILLVEDDTVVRHATHRILVAGGYTVLDAPNAEQARLVFAAHADTIDLVVTDVMMPGESGAALAAGLRQARPGLPVLYISGYPGEDLARLGLQVGEVELVRKPFAVRELIERVREVMGK
ncbi:MAG: response regulator [Gemmatimonadales bacterium]